MIVSEDTGSRISGSSESASRSGMQRHDLDLFTVLVGPTSLASLENVVWPTAKVKYLKKYKDPTRIAENHIYYDPRSVGASIAERPVPEELGALILRLNADMNCFFLAERERTSLFSGALLTPVEIANCARFAWAVLHEHAPGLIVFHNCPHELLTYVLLKTALALEIPVLLVHFSALPWRMSISRYASDGSARKLSLQDVSSEAEHRAVDSYMLRLQQTHDKAIPFSNQNWISPRHHPVSLRSELADLFRGAIGKSLIRIGQKLSIYRAFIGSVRDAVVGRYVVFLMHYQPEESTIPRGGVFSQQVNAIVRLRSLLPSGITILVKENRATFRAPLALAIGVRSRELYEAIASLPETHLVPLGRDTFSLIDGALAVGTITGTAGLEALCRGRKVIVFGDANYKGFSGVIRLDGPHCKQIDLAAAITGAPHEPEATRRDLLAELLCSIGPAEQDYESNDYEQQAAAFQAFAYVASNVRRLVGLPR